MTRLKCGVPGVEIGHVKNEYSSNFMAVKIDEFKMRNTNKFLKFTKTQSVGTGTC